MLDEQFITSTKLRSEEIIPSAGGRICDWLPSIDGLNPRSTLDIARRALIVNALLQIHFQAPTHIIREWIVKQDLLDDCSAREKSILSRDNSDLKEQEITDLYWYVEALWAFAWIGGLIPDLPIDDHVQNSLASLSPDLKQGEDGSKYLTKMKLRDFQDLYRMLDLYYRAHWFTRDEQLHGRSHSKIVIDVIMERRKALEWTMNSVLDWDDVPLNT